MIDKAKRRVQLLDRTALFIISITLLILCVGLPIYAIISCRNSKTAIPDIPAYPNSVLVGKYVNSSEATYRLLNYDYISDDSIDAIVEFYGQENCEPTKDDRWVCRGTTDLDGTYGSYIEASGNQTLISIEIFWTGCSFDFY